jgi:aldehyde dehydrogenase (NAD+)
MIEHGSIFVDGGWTPSTSTERIDVVNPATEQVIARIPAGGAEDVDRAARAAAVAFDSWSQTFPDQRAKHLRRMARLVEERSAEITRTIVEEVGQPVSQATVAQTYGAVEELDLMADCLSEISWDEPAGRAVVRRVPAGVVGAITAWNAPFRSIISKAGAAMAAGCTVVLKPSEVAPLTGYLFAEIATAAGVPDGVVNVVTGTGPVAGEAVVDHPYVDMVSLTGSVRAGRRVMELAAQSVKRVHLELGGKSANVILDDADLGRAIAVGLDDAYRNAGQVCGGLTRVLVPRRLLEDALGLVTEKAESFVLGDPFDPVTTLGPVTTADQRDRVRSFISGGMSSGLRMLTGGPTAPPGLERGYFVRPTVFVGDNSARIAREEVFGPVVVVIPYDDEDDAVRIANDSPYGLAAAVWAADDDHARSVARRLRVGRVRVNGAPLEKRAPHGGFKLSGIGREWGRYGVEEFLEYQSVVG